MRRKSDEHPSSTRDIQGELFAEFQTTSTKRSGHFFRGDIALGKKLTLNLPYENFVLFFIVIIMLLVVFFSLGVEKGKRVTLQNNKAVIERHGHKVIKKEATAEEEKSETVISEIDESGKFEPAETSKMIEKEVAEPSAKPYTIQVIAFKKEESAKKEMERLKSEGYEVFAIPSKEWVQICVGRYANRKELKKDLDALKKRYPTCYVRKIERVL